MRLAQLGCELAQGFYFARPVPESELMEMIGRPPVTVLTWARSVASDRERSAATVAATSRG